MRFRDLFEKRADDFSEMQRRRFEENARHQRERRNDPMLEYDNPDVRWIVADVNMGPGEEFFTGLELHAIWNRPEELVEDGRRYITSTMAPEKLYRIGDYRIVAIGLLPVAARRLAQLRNHDVLGDPLS